MSLLERALTAWDARPGNDVEARRLADALNAAALEAGCSPNQLMLGIQQARQQTPGLPISEAIRLSLAAC